MKKIFILLISAMVVFSACNSNSSNSKQHDFFDVDFGMPFDEVLKMKGEPDRQSDDPKWSYCFYNNQEMLGMSHVTLSYQADKNGIVICGANFFGNSDGDFDDDASYQSGYNSLKEILISEWGEPIQLIENDTDFKYFCSWGNKFLKLHKREIEGDILVTLSINAYRPDYLEENAWVTEDFATE